MTPNRFRTGLLAALLTVILALTACGAVATPTPTTAAPTIPFPDVPRTTLEEAKALHDAGTALFLDVRAADVYAVSHISGAVNIPLEELEGRLGELPKDEQIITICT